MRYFFVVNPTAGQGRAARIWDRLHQRLQAERVDFGYALTSEPAEATHMARDVVSAGYEAVVGVGGDGTLHEVAAGLPNGATLGVIPAGTGNDFARTVRLPKDPEAALQSLLASRPRPIDRCRVNGHPFLNIAGIGFDALVAKQVREKPVVSGSTLPYLLSVLRLLLTYKNTPISVEYDGGKTFEGLALLVAVGNGAYVGGGMRICPQAKVDDGLFDVCIVGDLGKTDALLNLPRIFRGTHTSHPKVTTFRARRLTIKAEAVPCQADGEPFGTSPAEFELEPGALHLLAPPQ